MYVIVNEAGQLYAGFENGKPVWFKTRRAESLIEEALADKVVSQPTELGFGPVAKRPSDGVSRKWVPTEQSVV